MGERVCKAPGCTTKLSRYDASNYCELHKNLGTKPHLEGAESEAETQLRVYASSYGFAADPYASLRRFKEHVNHQREPIVLGIKYCDGQLVFYCKAGQILGPLPGGDTKILLPPNAYSIVPFCSGLLSGLPTVSRLDLDKEHPDATITVEPCHSGKLVQVFYTLKS